MQPGGRVFDRLFASDMVGVAAPCVTRRAACLAAICRGSNCPSNCDGQEPGGGIPSAPRNPVSGLFLARCSNGSVRALEPVGAER